MSEPFESYPNSGTEAIDRLGGRLAIQLEVIPKQIQIGEALSIRFRFVFDNRPLQTLADWPSEDDCEDLESPLIPQGHFVAQLGYSGPQPREHFNLTGRAFQENSSTYSRSLATRDQKPGAYKFVIVAVGHIQVSGRAMIVARRLEFSFRLIRQTVQNPSFWVIEHTSRAWARHAKTSFFRIENGSIRAQTDRIVLPLMVRAPNNLLIAERLFDFDEETGDIYTAHVPVTHTFDQELRRVRANGQVEALPAIAGIDTKRILTLAVDGANRRLWLALPTALVVVSLDSFSVISNRSGVVAPTITVDPLSGELWAGAHKRTSAGQVIYGLKRFGVEGDPTIDVKTVVVGAHAPHSGMVSLNDGGVMVVGTLKRESKYIRITADGKVHSSSESLKEPIIQFGVNPETGQIWETILVHSRIPTLRRRAANFSTIHQFGLSELGFTNLYGVDYIPSLQAAVASGNARFELPPNVRGQLAKISEQGVLERITFSGNRMSIVKSIR